VQMQDVSSVVAHRVWRALHTYVVSPQNSLGERVQRMVYCIYSEVSDVALGRLIVLEGEALALGIVVNEQPAMALQVFAMLEASQMVGRSPEGISEGVSRPNGASGKGRGRGAGVKKGRGKGSDTDSSNEFTFQSTVGAGSQALLFVMMPCVSQKSDYDLSIVELRADMTDTQELGDCAQPSPNNAFSPVPARLADVALLGSSEHVQQHAHHSSNEDLELLAAISASLADDANEGLPGVPPGRPTDGNGEEEKMVIELIAAPDDEFEEAQVLAAISASLASENCGGTQTQVKDSSGDEDAEFELALAMSLAEGPGNTDTMDKGRGTACCNTVGMSLARPAGRWNRRRAIQ